MSGLEIAAFIIGIFTTVAAIFGMQCKTMRNVILGQLIANILLGLQYALEGAFSAAITVPFAIALSLISLLFSLKKRSVPLLIVLLFLAIFTAIVIITYTGIYDLLALAALFFFVLSITRTKSYAARICTALNWTFWLIYDILCAPSAILTHGVLLGFTVVGIIRLDRREWCAFFKKKAK